MFKTLRDAWSIAEIRKKLLYTLLMLLIFRLGSAVVVPFLDTSTVSTWMASNATGGNFLEYLDIITGGALSQATVFSLSITPYINASIIMQLLTYALPPLERMRDEGEEGQKRLNKITAAVSLALSVFMSFAYYECSCGRRFQGSQRLYRICHHPFLYRRYLHRRMDGQPDQR